MKYYNYTFANLPKNRKIVYDICNAAEILYKKLVDYNVHENNKISDYNKRYFGNLIRDEYFIIDSLQKYSYLLIMAISNINLSKDEVVFMDYGGGHGMLALLAKTIGLGTVIHNDIYEVSCKDAKNIGLDLNLQADYYIPGNIDDVIRFRDQKNININMICNYDVIEHIYNIEDFLNKLKLLSYSSQSVFFASGANGLNPRIRKKLMRQHLYFEHNNRDYKFGRKPTDETRALVKVREEIISKLNLDLTHEEIQKLVELTRGMMLDGIQDAAKKYTQTGKLPKKPSHPTNTCDPYTGNWFEHLMDPFHLANILGANGYMTDVIPGYYGKSKKATYNIIKALLNISISTNKYLGLKLAPFYSIMGYK